jgi:hypothetical protein
MTMAMTNHVDSELSRLVDRAHRAADSGSNDNHIAALSEALDCALEALNYNHPRELGPAITIAAGRTRGHEDGPDPPAVRGRIVRHQSGGTSHRSRRMR